MSFPDLRAFIDRLRHDEDIVTVDAPVDRHLEAAEIHRRVIAAGGPALMFTNVRDSGPGIRDSGLGIRDSNPESPIPNPG